VVVRLREWRERRGLSLRTLAACARVSFVTVYRIEAGTISPTVAMLEKLARALDVDLVDFFPPSHKKHRGGTT
jgi:transcriptional regulator with XRE-family HTH domain